MFSFYSPDGNEIAMPIASMSAYLKKSFLGGSASRTGINTQGC